MTKKEWALPAASGKEYQVTWRKKGGAVVVYRDSDSREEANELAALLLGRAKNRVEVWVRDIFAVHGFGYVYSDWRSTTDTE